MKNLLLFAFIISAFTSTFANGPIFINENIEWNIGVKTYNVEEDYQIYIHSFKNALFSDKNPGLPIYHKQLPLSSFGTLKVEIIESSFEPITDTKGLDPKVIGERIEVKTEVSLARRKALGNISFIPIRKTGPVSFERLVSFKLKVTHNPEKLGGQQRQNPVASALSTGRIFKIPVAASGIHKLDFNYLESLGVPVNDIDPRQIKLFGNGGGMVPEANNVARITDLQENAIFVQGEGDGSFDEGDFVLFYGQSPHHWTYSPTTGRYTMVNNLYDDNNYYFLRINDGAGNGQRIATQASLSGTAYSSDTFDDYAHFEEEKINVFAESTSTSGSGQEWFGPTFKFTNERTYDFNFPNLVNSEEGFFTCRVAGRAVGGGVHNFTVEAGTSGSYTENLGSVPGGIYQDYATRRGRTTLLETSGDDVQVKLNYNKPNSTAEGWLDYLELNVRRKLNMVGGQMAFRDKETLVHQTATFQLGNADSGLQVWDITNPLSPALQETTLSNQQLSFGFFVSGVPEFIAFKASEAIIPEAGAEIGNQNLHSMAVPNLLVIYHGSLQSAANRFVDFRRSNSNIEVTAVNIDQVYNEFSAGSKDVAAIRDFAKFLYEQPGSQLEHMLLFGDASFDYKNNYGNPNNNDMVPTYQTAVAVLNSLDSHPSDDFFGLLDDNEGANLFGSLDIGVGRFPVRNLTEAEAVVDKLIHYETSTACLGEWRNRLLFNADDEDSNIHFRDADEIAERVRDEHKIFNLEKLYFDAFNQESTPGGNRYPDVSEALNNNVSFKGELVVNYMGHGNPSSWAQERVFLIEEAEKWTNYDKLPLFVTATCTFGPYDDPERHSAGEILFTKGDGGAIALFTTVRAVFASTNKQLTRAVFNIIFDQTNGQSPTLGEVLAFSKNSQGAATANSRKFTLFGDPSMRMPRPKYNVVTTEINGAPVTGQDTIGALKEVTIAGYVEAAGGGVQTDFNGTIIPTFFDKGKMVRTLGNDSASSIDSFFLQKNIIFKGRTSVTDGRFSFTFVVPTDIDYSFGAGKISYYGHDGIDEEAGGYYDGVIVGGTAADGVQDNQPPLVEVYMNTEDFAFGGITDENPVLFAKISDDSGINTTGTGIGHDLTGVLDLKTSDTYVLNDFYESELDNSKKGVVRYPLSNLAEGTHTISVKAWDVSNNSGEDFTEFVVAGSAEIAINHVLNYPNPFTDRTTFQFEHNLPNQFLEVQIQIFTVSGRLIKTIDQDINSEGYLVRGIEWDGRDDYGDRIGRGVYVYKVKIGAANSNDDLVTSSSEFERLVILK